MKKGIVPPTSYHLIILGIISLAFLLRLPLLNGSFWLDEAAQALESARPLTQQLAIIPDFQPPLLHIVVHFMMYIGKDVWWLRLTSALIPSLITVWATAKIGERVMGKREGILAALLLATSAFHIFFSQELRPYSLPAMWAALGWLTIVKKPTTQNTHYHWRSLLLWSLISVCGWYSSYLYPFLWLSQVIFLIMIYHRVTKPIIVGTILPILSFIPWLPMFLQQLQAGQGLRQELPGWENVVSFSQLKTLPLVLGKFIFGPTNLELNFYYLGSAFLLSVITIATIWRLIWQKKILTKLIPNQSALLLITWLFVPLIAAWVVSFWVPVIQPKRVLFLLPAFYLGIIAIMFYWQNRVLSIFTFLFFLSLNLLATWQYYSQPQLQRENWRAVQQVVSQRYSPQDTLVIFAFPEPYAPWRWYDQAQFPTLSTGYLTQRDLDSDQVASILKYQKIITFDYLSDLSDPEHQILNSLKQYGYQEIDIIDYPNIGFVRVHNREAGNLSLK